MIAKAYDFALWLLPKVEKFPRSYRFSVGDRLVAGALDLLSGLVEASYSSRKSSFLQKASADINVLRYLLRLAKDLRLLSMESYLFAVERLDEVGRMSGGWLKSLRSPE